MAGNYARRVVSRSVQVSPTRSLRHSGRSVIVNRASFCNSEEVS